MVNPEFSVTPIDLWTAVGDPERTRRTALEGGYTRVLVSPEIEEAGVVLTGAPNLTRIPRVVFTAFHPDCVYALSEGKQVKGPLDAYHSMILIAAHRRGLSVDDAQRLFNGAFFEQSGYMDYWVPQRIVSSPTMPTSAWTSARVFDAGAGHRPSCIRSITPR